mmetsp:Transcript_69098/g.165743  ORF Transcript_69098/g.165743 Transcript_69098/m.165743 type:complete len:211 (+) Transcript_69098:1262-1894(+)
MVWQTLNKVSIVSTRRGDFDVAESSMYGNTRWMPLMRVRTILLSSSSSFPFLASVLFHVGLLGFHRIFLPHSCRTFLFFFLSAFLLGFRFAVSMDSSWATKIFMSCAASSCSPRRISISDRKRMPKYRAFSVIFARARKPDTSVATMLFIGGCFSISFRKQKLAVDAAFAFVSPSLFTTRESRALSCSGLWLSISLQLLIALVLKMSIVL